MRRVPSLVIDKFLRGIIRIEDMLYKMKRNGRVGCSR